MARERILNEIEILINKCIRLYDDNELDSKSIIYKMIDNKVFYDEDNGEIDMVAFKDNILLLVWAGHDTAASTICNLIYCLDQFGDIPFVIKLKQELYERKEELNDFDFIMNNENLDAFSKSPI